MNNEETLAFTFIKGKIDSKQNVNVFLVNGVKLEGVITKQDSNAFTMTTNSKTTVKEQLVHKQAVSTIT